MGDSLVYKLRSGKPPKFIYFAYDVEDGYSLLFL